MGCRTETEDEKRGTGNTTEACREKKNMERQNARETGGLGRTREGEVQGSEKNDSSERNRREGTGMQKGDTAPGVQDSPQLPLSELLGEFDSSDASFSVSLSLPLLSSSVAPVT